jgi:hypothetical protein
MQLFKVPRIDPHSALPRISAKPHFVMSTLAGVTALIIGLPNAGIAAGTQVPAAVPFAAFVAGFEHAQSADYVGRPGNRVAIASNFEDLRAHLEKLYAGVAVRESYSLDGQTFDCVRYDQQPAVRIQHLTSIAHPPPSVQIVSGSSASILNNSVHSANALAGRVVRPGVTNVSAGSSGPPVRPAVIDNVSCQSGTFPLPRVTLEQMAKFGSLREFFSKGPGTSGQVNLGKPGTGGQHAYAYAYQNVKNYGSYATESIYDPVVNTNLGEIFSLQQQWTVAKGTAGIQTAEIGWQAYPALYGTSQPVLFAYYTADGYNHTGCYNYSCGAFVQYSGSTIHLQTTIASVSTVGGPQYEISDGYYLYQGNWWLEVQGQWVGYYPGWLYNAGGSGGLETASTTWQVGTESDPGPNVWPPEGSGQFARAGYPYASFFNSLFYRDINDGLHYPSFTSVNPSPNCYSIGNQAYGGSSWNYYFFLGGPGGTNC